MVLVACGESAGGDEAPDEAPEGAAAPAESDGDDEAGDEEAPAAEGGSDDRDDWPDTITYGILPTTDVDELTQRYEPFETFMAECFDHPFELHTATNYVAVIEAMRTGHVHIAKFGPFSYILGNERAGAEAFVTGTSDPDAATYRAIFITLDDSGIETVEDLEGRTFGFVDPASASGHIFPRAHLTASWGVSNDEIEERLGGVIFTGGHDATITSILNGEIDAGAISENLWVGPRMDPEDGEFVDHPNFEKLVDFDATYDIPRALEAYQGDLPDSFKEKASECFQDVVNQPELTEYLETSNYQAGFIPTDDSMFDIVREAAEELGMSPEDLLAE